MLVLSILSLALASFSAILCFTVQEDVIRASLGCVAVLSILVTLFFAPWALKLTLAAVPFGVERFYRLSQNAPME
ncbi:riboflavin synthase subunit alpha [Synechocystis sp. PCC 7339]|uniref:riboflavin synthase subunit alpha n=1 Tax=Synechocystis TaxID=1142 RepID=UPI0018804288|nr:MULTISPECIES: riboflavin synthase subunit alpha [Synechocystis]MBE9203273.1 riboflavin synthase subunit alpha [Synechocystis salina LEGE 06099]QUS60465.1 riboflavin synthase subunit alpha [Synechocystis sp. PCC 7338]UAJ72094.1 riboflavin synthase subunit alpha [Synechocystis sp. PCC 7339]